MTEKNEKQAEREALLLEAAEYLSKDGAIMNLQRALKAARIIRGMAAPSQPSAETQQPQGEAVDIEHMKQTYYRDGFNAARAIYAAPPQAAPVAQGLTESMRSALIAAICEHTDSSKSWAEGIIRQALAQAAPRAEQAGEGAEMVARQSAEPVAWLHESDPSRVISAAQKAQALRDGGASASSVRPYSLAAYATPPAATGAQGLTDDGILDYAGFHGLISPRAQEREWSATFNAKVIAFARSVINRAHSTPSAQGLTSQRVEEIAKAYFHQDGTELGDMKTAIRVSVREALAQAAPAATAPSDGASDTYPTRLLHESDASLAERVDSWHKRNPAPSDGARQAEKSLAAIDKALRGRVNDPDPLPKLHAHTAAGEPTTYGLVTGLLRERDALLAKVGKFDQRIVDLGVLAMETAAPAPSASREAWAVSLIQAAIDIMTPDQIGQWTGVRAFLESSAPVASPAALTDGKVDANEIGYPTARYLFKQMCHFFGIELGGSIADALKLIDAKRAMLAASPADQGEDARRCQQCNAPRKGDECHKCGAPTVAPCAGWEEPALPPIDRIRELARQIGYAIGVHGTLERDLDLIAAPWSEEAAKLNYRDVMQHIANGLGARLVEVEGKPLGRRACTIQMDGWYKPIDLSVCPMLAASPADQVGEDRERQQSYPCPTVIDTTHPNRAYVTLGFGTEAGCKQFINATRRGYHDIAMSASKEGA